MPARKYFTEEEKRAASNESHKLWERRNPDYMAAKREREKPKRRIYAQMRRDRLGAGGKRSQRDKQLFCKYGITADNWDSMFVTQGFCCAACGTSQAGRTSNGRGTAWHTDHNPDYERGRPKFIRGILCHWCNIALHKRQTPSTLRALADYMEKHQ